MIRNNMKCSVGIYSLCIVFLAMACKKDETQAVASFDDIRGFALDKDAVKVLATNKGLFKLDIVSGNYTLLETDASINDLSVLKSFSYDLDQDLYVGSSTGAYNQVQMELYKPSESGITSNKILGISLDVSLAPMFGTPEGVSIFDSQKWSVHTGREDVYLNYAITDMATTSKGHTFVTTYGGGIGRYELDVDGASGATIMDTDWSRIPSMNVNTVYIYDTVQYYGTDSGIGIHYSEYTKSDWEAYTVNDGLIANNVLSIVRDKDSNLWFGTDAGLSKFDNENWISFTKEGNNLIDNCIKYMLVDTDGILWVATDKGIASFDNEKWVNYPALK